MVNFAQDAAKILEKEVVESLKTSKSSTDKESLILGLKTLLLPFSEKSEKYYDKKSALKTLPSALQYLIDLHCEDSKKERGK
jgi:hypothetical protein